MAGVTDGKQSHWRPPRNNKKQEKRCTNKSGQECQGISVVPMLRQRIGKQEQNRASTILPWATAADGYDRSTSGQCAERQTADQPIMPAIATVLAV